MVGRHEVTPDSWVHPALLAASASVVVLYRIGSTGLRADEAFSVSSSLRSWPELARLSYKAETNGALYACLLKLWSNFGTSEVWLRLPSAVAFVVAVALTWILGKRLHGEAAGAFGGGLLIVHGSFVQYGQNIRFYSPMVALGVGFGVLVHRSVEVPSRRRLVWVTAIGILLPLMHLLAATLIVAAAAIFVVDEAERRHESRSVGAERVRASRGSALGLWSRLGALLPGLLVALGVAALVSSRDEGQSINLPVGRRAATETLFVLSGSGGVFGAVGYALLLFAGLVTMRSSVRGRTRHGGRVVDVLVPWIVIATTLLCVAVGSLVTPVLVGRYVLFLAPYLAIAAAIGIVTVVRMIDTSADHASRRLGGMTLPATSPQPWGAQRVLTAAALCLTVLVGGAGAASGAISWIADDERVDWGQVSTALLARSSATDGVLFANDSARLFVEYGLLRRSNLLADAPTPVFPAKPWGAFRTGDQRYQAFSAEQVDAALAVHTRVWLVVEGPLVEEPFPDLLTVLANHRPAETYMFGRTGTLYLLEAATSN